MGTSQSCIIAVKFRPQMNTIATILPLKPCFCIILVIGLSPPLNMLIMNRRYVCTDQAIRFYHLSMTCVISEICSCIETDNGSIAARCTIFLALSINTLYGENARSNGISIAR